jgi:hypothetical protein
MKIGKPVGVVPGVGLLNKDVLCVELLGLDGGGLYLGL